MKKIEIGDVLRCLTDEEPPFNNLKVGDVVEVMTINSYDDVLIEFDGHRDWCRIGDLYLNFVHTKKAKSEGKPIKPFNLKRLEKRISSWNERCGNHSCTAFDSLNDVVAKTTPQAKVILEEAKELVAALESKDETEIKDGVVDVLFTALRLISLLKEKYDIFGMAEKVCDNNDLKWTTDQYEADLWEGDDGVYTHTTIIKGRAYYCMKDNNGKVRKWKGFPKVDLV